MTSFNEIKIIGFDEDRLPRVRKEAYIDLFYQLSEEAPEEWCEDFERYGRQIHPPAKVDKSKRCFINTYINDMNDIPVQFEQLKLAVLECNAQYREKLRQREEALARENANLSMQGGKQYELNEIVASLKFDSH